MLSERLQRAHVALARGAHLDAFEPLLFAWQETRVVELAAVIEPLAADLWPPPPLARAVVGFGRALEKPSTTPKLVQLLARLGRVSPTVALQGVEALGGFPDDPRTTTALLRLLGHMPAPGAEGHLPPLRAVTLARLVALRDRRAVEPLLQDGLPDAGAAADELSRACAALPAFAPADASAANALIPMVGARSDRLLESVLSSPGDLSLRAVYGDWLLERGDPRGELIALQLCERLDAQGEARVAALLRKHAGAWVGAIAHAVRRESMVFRHGFLTRCIARKSMLSTEKWEAVVAEPLWATVEELSISSRLPGRWARRLADMPQLRALRSLHVEDPAVREALPPSLATKLVRKL
jgi:uncharacterized protein (TIGR02996 family)